LSRIHTNKVHLTIPNPKVGADGGSMPSLPTLPTRQPCPK